MGLRVLVTGGAGFIGSHLVEHFVGEGADVRVLDNFRSGHQSNLDAASARCAETGASVTLIEGSITDRDAVRRALDGGVDYVFHFAAMISVPESMLKPIECVEMNAIGTLIVLEEAERAGVQKLTFSSSAAVYGDNPTVPKIESMVPEPKSPYAVTKLDGEYYLRSFATEGRLATASMRYFNVFGPRQDPASAYAAAVPIFIAKALAGEPLTIFGDGGATRDFVFVKDIVAANVFLAQHPTASETYNIGYGRSLSIGDLARKIVAMTGSSSPIIHAAERPGDVRHSMASADKIAALGFKPERDFDEALATTIEYFK